MSAKITFPEVGIYCVLGNSQGLWLFQKNPPHYHLPFFPLEGGESWEGLLSRVKSTWGMSMSSHELLGVGARPTEEEKGRAFCIFELRGKCGSTPGGHVWEDPQKMSLTDPITLWIVEHFFSRS